MGEGKHFGGESNVERPELQDLVKIDGRWAQVLGGGNAVKFLDNEEERLVNWDNLALEMRLGAALATVLEDPSVLISSKEMETIRWGSEQDTQPQLKRQVTVFGFYKTKEQQPK